MKNWKRNLIESLVLGAALAVALIFTATQTGSPWLQPAFYVPFQGAALLSGIGYEPPPLVFHALLFVQCYAIVLALGWLVGRYRGRPAEV